MSHAESSRADRILAAARRQFEAAGFRGTGIADIADEAGVAPGTIYWHFRGKEELFLHLIDEDNAAWLERARNVLASPGTALERIANLASASAKSYQSSKLLLAVLRRDRRLIHPPLLEDIHTRLAKQSISLMAKVIREGIKEGSIRTVNAEKVAAVLFAAGHALFNQSNYSYEDLAVVLMDIAIHGLEGPRRPSKKRSKRARRG